MKSIRFFFLLFVSFLFLSQFTSFASASFLPYQMSYAVQEAILTVQETLRPVFEALIGGYSSSEFLFAKVLLLVLVFVMCQYALKQVPSIGNQNAVVNIVSAVVSILAIRYLQDNDLINGILLPYGALGVALTTVLPFIIYFFFVHKTGTNVAWRRIAWIFFGVIFAVLWYSRSAELSPLGNQIFGWTLFALAIVFFFDKQIHNYFDVKSLKNMHARFNDKRIAHLEVELQELVNAPEQTSHIKERIKVVEKELERLNRED